VANSINGFSGNGATSVETNRTTQQPTREQPSVTTSSSQSDGGDQVQITSTASRLATLGQSLSAMSPIDSGRVAHVSQAIADGTYSISADKIASGLMQSDHALAQIGL
jgi:negative regulator of flagellin synthesis FlgM